MQTETNTLQSPYCGQIRSKQYYNLQQMPTEASHLLDQSGWCWCRKTMQTIGPDGELVQPEDCTAQRGCYVSLFADSSQA